MSGVDITEVDIATNDVRAMLADVLDSAALRYSTVFTQM
jgi:hypothetical protein